VVLLPLSLYRVKNRVCLSRIVYVTDVSWRATMRIVIGVRDLLQRTENGRTGWVLDGRVIERSGGVVCSLHRTRGDEKCEFLS
jgi:hypothetical protein